MDLNLLAGPAALAIAATAAVAALWRAHTKADDLRDVTIKALSAAVVAFPEALKELTAVVNDSVERERARARRVEREAQK